jgi:flagellar hook-associated protein 2
VNGAVKIVGYDPLTVLTGAPGSPGSHRGLDVTGTIGGAAATGVGRVLTATGAGAQGLSVEYTGTAPAASSITFSRGIGSLVELAAKALLGSANGSIDAVTKNLDTRLQSLASRADTITQRLEVRRAELVRRFTALEQAMARAQSQSQWLTAQITRLDNSGKK